MRTQKDVCEWMERGRERDEVEFGWESREEAFI